MPYITQDDRDQYDERLDDLCLALDEHGWQAGDVTYVLYMIVARWFKKVPKYTTIAAIRGCLMGTLSEMDRQFFFPYEDSKIRVNGDVDLKYTTMEFDKTPVELCASPACKVCRDAPVEFEPEEGDPDFDECPCGSKALGVHAKTHSRHQRGS